MMTKGTVHGVDAGAVQWDDPLRPEGLTERPARRLLQAALQALVGLNDAALHTVVCRAQGLLLDHRVPPHAEDQLTVDIVTGDESHLLATYRALPPHSQQHVLGYIAQQRAAAKGE